MTLRSKDIQVLEHGEIRMIVVVIMVLLNSVVSHASVSDIYCLQTLKESLLDPLNSLVSWDFSNRTDGFICKFIGIDCWHPDENKVLNIRLSDMGLMGEFPSGLENCSSVTGLDLSNNLLNGSIPSNISVILKFVTNLDLSSNSFSGEIPASLSNCSYLNVLRLNDNKLGGKIPLQLGFLDRIKTFTVANNLLSGQVPTFNSNIPPESYANNPALCGKPLPVCRGPPWKSHVGIVAGAAVGGITFTAIFVGFALYYFSRGIAMKKEDDPEGNRWARNMKAVKGVKVSMFEKSVSKMKLTDLMKATNNFSKYNIAGTGRTGTMYKAIFADGSTLVIKRLQDTQHSEKEFMSEMKTLGSVKHGNLVPLLGYCVAKKERFLVYKYMENGTLFDQLHPLEPDTSPMKWPLRLKIGIGAAKGLAWLHHNCNPRIIHRNISSKCILLDEKFEPQLSDFGLARLMNPIDTHLSTFVNGEFGDLGYVAPEYPRTLVATRKGDVYSFGVVLLELCTGEKPTSVANSWDDFKGSLAEWINYLSIESLQRAIDKSLLGSGFDNELSQFIKVAAKCVLPDPKERPTMFEVCQLLRAIGERYHFTNTDDVMVPSDMIDADVLDELIVSREMKEFR